MTTRLIPCANCERHVRSHDLHCPFCGAARPEASPGPESALTVSSSLARGALALGAVALLNACGPSLQSVQTVYVVPQPVQVVIVQPPVQNPPPDGPIVIRPAQPAQPPQPPVVAPPVTPPPSRHCVAERRYPGGDEPGSVHAMYGVPPMMMHCYDDENIRR